MEVVHECCAGFDVHKKTVMACVRRMLEKGRIERQVREFGTMTADILALGDWLSGLGVTHVAMESTGVFWKPIWNLLEGSFEILLCNAQHIKKVPGRKTDVKDCEWIAQLLQHGLLRASFVPERDQRDLRDLTRNRAQLVQDHTRVVNRVHKTLEDANIKLGSVATDIMGVSGRLMLESMIRVEMDPEKLAELAQRRLRGKIPQLKPALEGRLREHHRFMLEMLLDQLKSLEGLIRRAEVKIEEISCNSKLSVSGEENSKVPFDEAVRLLDTIPGINTVVAQGVVAEIGTEMGRFPTSGHLASWAGMSPGNNESAGKRRSGKTTKGNRWLKTLLVQAAWAAARTKNTYLQAQFRRLVGRRGKKRALVAVGHTILVMAYQMLKNRTSYAELGPDYFDRLDPQRTTRYLVKRLEALGHKVTLEPQQSVA